MLWRWVASWKCHFRRWQHLHSVNFPLARPPKTKGIFPTNPFGAFSELSQSPVALRLEQRKASSNQTFFPSHPRAQSHLKSHQPTPNRPEPGRTTTAAHHAKIKKETSSHQPHPDTHVCNAAHRPGELIFGNYHVSKSSKIEVIRSLKDAADFFGDPVRSPLLSKKEAKVPFLSLWV